MSERLLHILIVEDDPDLQNVYKLILQSQGYRVSTANDGMAGLAALRKKTPDVILLDYFMPQMDGKVFLQNFDKNNYLGVKIILTTNVSDKTILDELLALGADRSVLKADLSPTDLLKLIEEITA